MRTCLRLLFNAAAMLAAGAITLLPAAPARAQITFGMSLVSQFDPFPGDNRYGDVFGFGNLAYIGSNQGNGVGIIDISNPAAPVLASHYNPPGGQFKDVQATQNVAFFASDNGGGLHIVDVSNPYAPVLLSHFTEAQGGHDHIHNVFYHNGLIYEADSRTPVVKVIDVSNPAAPVFLRDIVTTDPLFIHDITVVGNRLYTSGWGGTTDMYDISNIRTQAPPRLGTAPTLGNSHSSWATADNRILVSAREDANGHVLIFDVSDPANPVNLHFMTAQTEGLDAYTPHDPRIVGNLLFISWYQAGVQVYDISVPTNPVRVAAYDTFPGPVNFFDGNWGVDPFLGMDRILASDMDGGLLILRLDSAAVPEPGALALLAASGLTGLLLLRRARSAKR
jgi:hypothetical protein